MNKPHIHGEKQIYSRPDNALQFRLSRIKDINFFIAEISDREQMSRTLNKYIEVLDYADRTLLVLSDASSNVFLCLFTTVVGVTVGKGVLVLV